MHELESAQDIVSTSSLRFNSVFVCLWKRRQEHNCRKGGNTFAMNYTLRDVFWFNMEIQLRSKSISKASFSYSMISHCHVVREWVLIVPENECGEQYPCRHAALCAVLLCKRSCQQRNHGLSSGCNMIISLPVHKAGAEVDLARVYALSVIDTPARPN